MVESFHWFAFLFEIALMFCRHFSPQGLQSCRVFILSQNGNIKRLFGVLFDVGLYMSAFVPVMGW